LRIDLWLKIAARTIAYAVFVKIADLRPSRNGEHLHHSQPDVPDAPREGYHQDASQEKSGCDRPGCYKRFTPPPRSPLQKFCCSSCYQALRAVLLRERRWLQWLRRELAQPRDGPL